jgi:hypothetical protein
MAAREELLFCKRDMSPFGHVGLALLATSVVGLFVLGGCGKGTPPFQEVSGRVTLQKQPLRKGLIEFVPTTSGGSSAGTIIRDGQYVLVPAAGLLPGFYRVKIVPTVPVRADWEERPQGGEGRAPEVVIPEKYNVKTTLTAEVSADGKHTIDFQLD